MPVLLAKANFCHGTRCLICMKYTACLEVTDVNRKGRVQYGDQWGVLSQLLETTEISHCKTQAVSWLSFFKVPVLELSLEFYLWWKGRRNTLWGLLTFFCCWLLSSTFRHVCTYGLVFSLWSHAAVCLYLPLVMQKIWKRALAGIGLVWKPVKGGISSTGNSCSGSSRRGINA